MRSVERSGDDELGMVSAHIMDAKGSDAPRSLCPVIAGFMRGWCDGLANDADRDRLLKPLIPRAVGTRNTAAVEETRRLLALDWMIRVYAPAWLDLVEELRWCSTGLRELKPIVDTPTAVAAGKKAHMAMLEAGPVSSRYWGGVGALLGEAYISAGEEGAGRSILAASVAAAGKAAWDVNRKLGADAWAAAGAVARAAAAGEVAAAVWAVLGPDARPRPRWEPAVLASPQTWDAAKAAAGTAVQAMLEPVTRRLQDSAFDLVGSMCQAG